MREKEIKLVLTLLENMDLIGLKSTANECISRLEEYLN